MTLESLNSTPGGNWPPSGTSARLEQGRFHNLRSSPELTWRETAALWLRFAFTTPEYPEPERTIPVSALTREDLLALPAGRTSLVRLGHSSVLLKMAGEFWLIDPVFSERASPFTFAGPKRFHPPPVTIEELPPIKGVLISHNHYDHLDEAAVRKLHGKVERFHVPLGVGGDLARWGVPAEKIAEYDWWQSRQVGEITLVATPAQHFSGRGLGDRNRTLWCSWALRAPDARIFYSGDTGYFEEFRRIGEEYGPFDLTLLETGAYDDAWPHVHMQPEETLQAHLDLRGRQLLPVHNGTFQLAFHPWFEPLERISRLASENGVALLTPAAGEVISLGEDVVTARWWRALMPQTENDRGARPRALTESQ